LHDAGAIDAASHIAFNTLGCAKNSLARRNGELAVLPALFQETRMLALQKIRPGDGVVLDEIAAPTLGSPEHLLIKVAATGICGTDLHIDRWADAFQFIVPLLPVTLGHEFTGEVVDIGAAVTGFKLGDRVVVQPALSCGKCAECRSGRHYDCPNRIGMGLQASGGFASLVTAPAKHCLHVPAAIDAELGALIEPLTTSAHAVTLGEVKPGDHVVVFGPGPIGQAAAIFARRAGATRVAIVGHGDKARFKTLRILGFDDLVDLGEPDGQHKLAQLAGAGFDVAIEASGAPVVINIGLGVLKPFGIFVLAGMPEKHASLDVMLLVRGRHHMIGCSRAPDTAWEAAIDALVQAPDSFRPMITHRLSLKDGLDGFQLAHSRAASKVLLYP
jgi:threonine dehydrogenase-like Zn-dependent dehydrogenase